MTELPKSLEDPWKYPAAGGFGKSRAGEGKPGLAGVPVQKPGIRNTDRHVHPGIAVDRPHKSQK